MSTAPVISDFLLEQVLLDEPEALPISELARRFGVTESSILQRLNAMEQADEEIRAMHPPARVRARVGAMLAAENRKRRTQSSWLAVAATASLLCLFGGPPFFRMLMQPDLSDGASRSELRAKGAPQILVYRKGGGMAKQLRSGSRAVPDDVLQLGYVAAGAPYGVMLSVDGRGAVTLHFPEDADASTALNPSTTVLPYSFRLDDAPDFERFVLLTSDTPLDVHTLLHRARRLYAEPIVQSQNLWPRGVYATYFVLAKPNGKESK